MIGERADAPWHSPLSGAVLHPDGPHALVAPGERWPVVDGIAYLRTGRADLVHATLHALDRGDTIEATALLLADRDDWAPGAPPTPQACRHVAAQIQQLTLRETMAALSFGPVADYLAHRWSDPTFLSGLALAEAYWQDGARIFELACGTGPFLRAFAPHAATVTGGDVVFSKLWLARHFVAPDARLVCFDACQSWPVAPDSADIAFCHDAFYFLPRKGDVAARLRAVAPVVLIGHAHNALVGNHSAGAPLTPAGYAALLPGAALFDDAELTAALVARRAPIPADAADLARTPAIALASAGGPPRTLRGLLDRPRPGAPLRRNPLYIETDDGMAARHFPSPRYAAEYADLVTYPPLVRAPASAVAGEGDDPLVRSRVLLELPDRW